MSSCLFTASRAAHTDVHKYRGTAVGQSPRALTTYRASCEATEREMERFQEASGGHQTTYRLEHSILPVGG